MVSKIGLAVCIFAITTSLVMASNIEHDGYTATSIPGFFKRTTDGAIAVEYNNHRDILAVLTRIKETDKYFYPGII